MISASHDAPIGLLFSGGLDSAVLLGRLLDEGRRVQPFYVRCGLVWETAELRAAGRFARAVACRQLAELVVLDLPLGDLFADHWSLTGDNVPAADTPDEAAYLPGRNALLALKPFLWCQQRGIAQLALAPLESNPFADATDEFFVDLQTALNRGAAQSVEIVRPFARLHKTTVLRSGRTLPLELTFSCLAPRGIQHCGACNKCGERQLAFQTAGLDDPTEYATQAPVPTTT